MKTYIDVLEETVDFYSADPVNRRAVLNNVCQYCSDDGRMCSIGRLLDQTHAHYLNLYKSTKTAGGLISEFGFSIFKPEYRDIKSRFFWEDLQRLHDKDRYWTENGLSGAGELFVEHLREKYKGKQT